MKQIEFITCQDSWMQRGQSRGRSSAGGLPRALSTKLVATAWTGRMEELGCSAAASLWSR